MMRRKQINIRLQNITYIQLDFYSERMELPTKKKEEFHLFGSSRKIDSEQ